MASKFQAGEIFFLPYAHDLTEDDLKTVSFDKNILGHPCVILDPGTEDKPTKIALTTSLGGKTFTTWAEKNQHLANYRVPIGPLAIRSPYNPYVLEVDNPAVFHKASWVETHQTFPLPKALSTKLRDFHCKLQDSSFNNLLSELAWARVNPMRLDAQAMQRNTSTRRASAPELSVCEQLKRTYQPRATKSAVQLSTPTTTTTSASESDSASTTSDTNDEITPDTTTATSTANNEAKPKPTTRVSFGPPMASMFASSRRPGHVKSATVS